MQRNIMARIFNKQKAETLFSSGSCSEVYESLSEPENSFCKKDVPKREIRFFRADAAGNVTLLVTSHVEEADYAAVARYLLAINELDGDEIAGEQVAFVVDEDTMCMCGHEFCGNASRSFALMKARGLVGTGSSQNMCREEDKSALQTITINASGVDHPLNITADAASGFTKIKMPGIVKISDLPEKLLSKSADPALAGKSFQVARMDGITHVIAYETEPTADNFNAIQNALFNWTAEKNQTGDHSSALPPAAGVMFVESHTCRPFPADTIVMTPVVYVTEVDTTYFEGSCGSGTTALCAALSEGRSDGTYIYDVIQPKGTIRCSCIVRNGSVKDVFIEGPVSISREYIVLL